MSAKHPQDRDVSNGSLNNVRLLGLCVCRLCISLSPLKLFFHRLDWRKSFFVNEWLGDVQMLCKAQFMWENLNPSILRSISSSQPRLKCLTIVQYQTVVVLLWENILVVWISQRDHDSYSLLTSVTHLQASCFYFYLFQQDWALFLISIEGHKGRDKGSGKSQNNVRFVGLGWVDDSIKLTILVVENRGDRVYFELNEGLRTWMFTVWTLDPVWAVLKFIKIF